MSPCPLRLANKSRPLADCPKMKCSGKVAAMMTGCMVGEGGNGAIVGGIARNAVDVTVMIGDGVTGIGVLVMVIEGMTVIVGEWVGVDDGTAEGGTNRVGKSRWGSAGWQAAIEMGMIMSKLYT